ncbi:hypothetical protein CGC58_01240 [Capnocytophaga stomatis]|uniref:Uncharacterized protein n=1 Tax=Capnocytophaga stomatis TaxID=1848904 RepID=A0A250FWY8_9FLAO|nr:hypothetical protein CGC58_01240 [Capnocytophaga stomatis]
MCVNFHTIVFQLLLFFDAKLNYSYAKTQHRFIFLNLSEKEHSTCFALFIWLDSGKPQMKTDKNKS